MTASATAKRWTLAAVCLGTFMLLLDVTIVVVALPDLQAALGAGFDDVQWTIDAYALSLAALLLVTGSLADLFGRRLVFAAGLGVFTAGSLLCGLAQSPLMLILSRAFQGIGGATVFSTSLALLAQTFHGRERGTAFGAWGAVAGLSTTLGPLLGGALTTGLGWRWIFLVNLPLGVVAIAIALTRVEESRPGHARRVDGVGFAMFTLALLALVYGLIRAGEHGWGDAVVPVSLAVAAVLLVAFPLWEAHTDQPMFDLRLFRKPTFVGGSIAAFGMNGSLYAMFLYFVIYLQTTLGYSALQTGLRLLLVTAAGLVVAVPAGRLSAHVPVRLLIGPGLLLVGLGLLLMRGIDARSGWIHLLPGFLVAGLGSGFVNPPLASTAIGVVAPQDAGMASGINTTFRQVGVATGIAALGSIFAARIGHGSARDLPAVASALNELLLVVAVVAIAAGVLSLALIRQRDFVVTRARRPAGEAGVEAA
ncbi:MAG TPA: MFS transporter [Solirubrobacteraceae bacterium]|nr:MFS transporter [Solirubrobacteraceae bacterium]